LTARRVTHALRLKEALDAVRKNADLVARRAADPVAFVHRYRARADRELVALVAASVAFGNVKAIRAKLEELFTRVGPSPSRAADRPAELFERLSGFRHRVYRGEDLAGLLVGARAVQRQAGSLGHAFAAELASADRTTTDEATALREALGAFADRIREAGGLPRAGEPDPEGRRGPAHLLADARKGSGAKRLLLFLRWMVRAADGIDLGLWRDLVPARRLLMPVDVHIHKLGRNLGLTARRDVSWRTAVEITRALGRLSPDDPVRYDFSLCHMGMVQRCPSRKDRIRCEGCGVKPVCLHWRASAAVAAGRAPGGPVGAVGTKGRDFARVSVRA
jgi:uncharacterized protein (TIGR02757 family)